jgi:L,D-transpeptidase YbiS
MSAVPLGARGRPHLGSPGPPGAAWAQHVREPRLRRARRVLLAAAAVLAVLVAPAWLGRVGYRDLTEVRLAESDADAGPAALRRMERSIARQAPQGAWVAVDVVGNRLYLRRGRELLREAVCSTGTGGLLEDPASGRRWIFDTPRGARSVRERREKPVWNKPDWAFVEEGLPIPTDPRERLDPYSLGDYALDLGDGYLIHGTLYQRLLGRSVTHGCVRLGDEDLEAVWTATGIGTRVYLY